MLTEGIGTHAPSKQRLGMSPKELRFFMEAARKRATHRSYRNQGQWGKGLVGPLNLPGIGSVKQEERSIFVGLLGEYATQQYIDRRFPEAKCVVDTSLLPHGDFGVDLKPFGLKIDVKTREFKANADNVNRIKRTDERGNPLPVHPHAFLFTEWDHESPTSVYLLGWVWSAFVAELPLMPSVGKWMNACVFDSQLLPMSGMASELEVWKARASWR